MEMDRAFCSTITLERMYIRITNITDENATIRFVSPRMDTMSWRLILESVL